MPLTDAEKRKIARAIWSYTGEDQKTFAEKAGVKYDRLRALLNDPKKSPPTTDELLEMASAAGIPPAVVIDGWAASDPVAQLQAELRSLRGDLEELSLVVAQQGEELQAVRDRDHRTARPGDEPR